MSCCSTWLQDIFFSICFYVIDHCINFDLGHTTLEYWEFVPWGCWGWVSKSRLVSMVMSFSFIAAVVHYCVLLVLFSCCFSRSPTSYHLYQSYPDLMSSSHPDSARERELAGPLHPPLPTSNLFSTLVPINCFVLPQTINLLMSGQRFKYTTSGYS